MTAAEIADLLHATRTAGGWAARCPAHDDRNASLSLTEGRDGRTLLRCHAGCEFSAIVAAMGLKPSDLFPPRASAGGDAQRRIVARYPYTDADGRLLFEVVRFDPKDFRQRRPDPEHPGAWLWNMKAVDRVLFRQPDVLKAVAAGQTVFIVEGEKDALALAGLGLAATCNPGGAGKWQDSYTAALKGARIAILPDRDDPGRKHGELVARALRGNVASLRVIELPDRNGRKLKDTADWIGAGGTREELVDLVDAAPEWTATATVAPEPTAATGEPIGLPVDAARLGAPYPMTDLGNSERLVALHGDAIRWDVARKTWRIWDGRRWAADAALQVNALAAETARAIRREAADAPRGDRNSDLGRELFNWAVRSESRDRLAAMVEVAKSRPGIVVTPDALDADTWALNVLNGTLDLRTGKMRPHRQGDLLTKLAPVEYRAGLRDARFEAALSDWTGGDADLADFLQVAAGYTLTGQTTEEVLFLVYGPEASGKTTFLELLRAILGEYARTVQADLLTKQRDNRGAGAASPELAGLAGARLAAASEMEQGREIAEALAKNLTGGEPITARHLYAELFDFLPQFKLWLALNHCPKVSADDGAIWRRILRIGFEYTVPPERRDKTLKPYLRDPAGGAPAVLAWAVEGCLRWQREGLKIPAAVERSTAAYREESDPLAPFLEDCIRFTDGDTWTPWADLWQAYNDHAEESGTAQRYRVAPKRLQDRLRARGCVVSRRHAGRGWVGVALNYDWQTAERDAVTPRDGISKTFFHEEITKKSYGKDDTHRHAVTLAPNPEPETLEFEL